MEYKVHLIPFKERIPIKVFCSYEVCFIYTRPSGKGESFQPSQFRKQYRGKTWSHYCQSNHCPCTNQKGSKELYKTCPLLTLPPSQCFYLSYCSSHKGLLCFSRLLLRTKVLTVPPWKKLLHRQAHQPFLTSSTV